MNHFKTYLFIIILVVFARVTAYAQCGPGFPYTSEFGTFQVSEVKGCVGTTIQVCINSTAFCDCVSCVCNIEYEDDVFDDSNNPTFTYTYNTTGTFTLEILYPNNNGVELDRIQIEITDKEAPDFEAFTCAGNSVKVDIQDTQYDNYLVDFGDGTSLQIPLNAADPEHTYVNAQPRTITVQGIDNNAVPNCPVASEIFTPANSVLQNTITQLTTLDDNSLELRSNLEPNILYELEIQPNGSGAFSFLRVIDESNVIDTVRNIDLANNYYCFRIAAIDACSLQKVYSNTICSINLALDVQDGNNALTWQSSNPSSNFEVVRTVITTTGSNTTNPFDTTPPSVRLYNDQNINCNVEYCYQMEAFFNGGLSISNRLCGESFTTQPPPFVNDISIIVDGSDLQLDWEDPIDTEVNLYEFESNGLISSTESSELIDPARNPSERAVCYTITTVDECGNRGSTPQQVCSIHLRGTITRDNQVQMSWNNYRGYENGVSTYRLEKFYNLNLVSSITLNELEFAETDNNEQEQVMNYRVTALPVNSTLAPSVSNILTFIKPNNIHHPSAFTPDGNGNNDTFSVKGRYFTDYRMQIFNRWGELVFTSTNEDIGWDGTFNGKPQQEGTYVFNLEVADLAGRELKRSGSFILLRK